MSKQPEPVGYKHPPRAHQFQPGQSGNPAGRPKGARSLKADLRDELAEVIPFGDGNRAVELSKQRVLIKKLVGAAIEGDARAVATVLSITLRALGDEECEEPEEAPEDREILQVFASRSAERPPTKTGVVGKRHKGQE
jgi:hypothetical protein